MISKSIIKYECNSRNKLKHLVKCTVYQITEENRISACYPLYSLFRLSCVCVGGGGVGGLVRGGATGGMNGAGTSTKEILTCV